MELNVNKFMEIIIDTSIQKFVVSTIFIVKWNYTYKLMHIIANSFILQGCIKLIKSDKDFYFK